jgi:hypothetical protein
MVPWEINLVLSEYHIDLVGTQEIEEQESLFGAPPNSRDNYERLVW